MVANESFAPIATNVRGGSIERAPAMYTRTGMKSQKQIAWLMALGRGLRVEYDKQMQPLPPGLAALVEQYGSGTMDIYEVALCRRGRWEQQDVRFVAAGDADEAAYKVIGEHLHSEGERRKVRLRVRKLGNGSPPPKLFYAA